MQAQTLTPSAIFGNHVRYVVPLFQRPYVWNKDEQWEPLWEDISTLADRLLDVAPGTYGAPLVSAHFLGAIVLDQQLTPSAYIGVRHVIDGQQRLTTLQIVLDAAQWVVEQVGHPMDAQALRVLVLNDINIAQTPDEVFKVWPTDRDQAAFRAAMNNDAAVPTELASSRIAKAHAFFVAQIHEWANAEGPDNVKDRLHVLVLALREYLKIVVIDLEPGDNAQVIFETLNHRGAPLLAADLVKNFLFQMVSSHNGDVEGLYHAHWRDLDSDYWRQPVSQGRLFRPRIDTFLNYWLTMRLLREVPSDRVFADFREYVVVHQPDIKELLGDLSVDADVYRNLDKMPATSVEGRFYYRVIRASDIAAVGPVLLWLLRYPSDEMRIEQREKALRALESWVVRRVVVGAKAQGLNLLMVDLLKELGSRGPATAGDTVESFLSAQTADSRVWPSDQTVTSALTTRNVYTGVTRARLRMVLEALEDSYRGDLSEGEMCPRNLTVEHVMPQAWREHWGADIGDDLAAGIARDALVQTIGNLTLVSGKLNPTLSNLGWHHETTDGDQGKQRFLQEHSVLKLNSKIASHQDWSEQAIKDRTHTLVTQILALWPRPDVASEEPEVLTVESAAEPAVDVREAVAVLEADEDLPGHAGKYRPLWAWLSDQNRDEIMLHFSDVEQILGFPLPASARIHLPYWYGNDGTALGRAIRDAGWRASQVNLTHERVTFVREP